MAFDHGNITRQPIPTIIPPPIPTETAANPRTTNDIDQLNRDKLIKAEQQLANGCTESTLMGNCRDILVELCRIRNLSTSGTKKILIAALFEWVCYTSLLMIWI